MPTQTKNIARLLQIMARLRGPDGCPWDREQTHQSIRHNLIEETYETLDALDAGDMQEFKSELGDLLLQVVFHAQMASEVGIFNFDEVAQAIADKLVHRHPHVFSKGKAATSADVLKQWEAIKKEEKQAQSIIAEIPRGLPALMRADKVQRKVARVGFDWKETKDVLAKIEEELEEVRDALRRCRRDHLEEEVGDLLFAVVNLARFEKLHAEDLLDKTVKKFVGRFQQIERAVHASGRKLEDCTLGELEELWQKAKQRPRPRRSSKPRPRARARHTSR